MYIFCNFNMIMEASDSVYNDKIFYLNQGTTYHGTLQNISDVTSLQECSTICLKDEACEAILFNKIKAVGSKCNLIKYGVNAIDIGNMDGYSYFTKGECLGVPMPETWKSGCPQLYLNMDNMHGGQNMGLSKPQFVPHGKLGSMFHHPKNGTVSNYAGFGFAWYTGTDHCFSQPKNCNKGVSYAVWVNLLGDNENLIFNGFFTSMMQHIYNTQTGVHGGWIPGYSLFFEVITNDTKDTIFFPLTHGYNNWVHYVFVYKYGGSIPGSSDIKVYLNGVEQNTTRISIITSRPEATKKYLIIGSSHATENFARMNMDELLVWQKMLSPEDIKKLYDAYQ